MDAASVAAGPRGARRVLVISPGPVGERMPGPSIRATELARALEPHAQVTLAAVESGDQVDPALEHVSLVRERPLSWRAALEGADVIVTPPPLPDLAHWCRRSGARLIYDVYDPEPLEVAAHPALNPADGARPSLRHRAWATLTTDRVIEGLRDAHHFICASERQRDLWLGALMAEGRLDSGVHADDPGLRELIDVVPFGLPSDPPRAAGGGPRERFAGIGADDEVVLWNGGIWNWLDAETAIRAVGLLSERRPSVRLVFMGGSDDVNAREATAAAVALAGELGLLDRFVFFNEAWVPYDERATWMLQASCALSAHQDRLETRFAFRTRLLDCFWARLPIVCTRGDELADRIEREAAGAVVPSGDPEAMAGALEQVLTRGRDAYAEPLASLAAEYSWPRLIGPLVRWIELGPPSGPARRRGGPTGRRLRGAGYRWARLGLDAAGLRVAPRMKSSR